MHTAAGSNREWCGELEEERERDSRVAGGHGGGREGRHRIEMLLRAA